jgi:hypothetical protein
VSNSAENSTLIVKNLTLIIFPHLLYSKFWDFNQFPFNKSNTKFSNPKLRHAQILNFLLYLWFILYSRLFSYSIWRFQLNKPSNIYSHIPLHVPILFIFKTQIKNREIRDRERMKTEIRWKIKIQAPHP